MLESFKSNESFEYQKLTEEEQAQRGILGRLTGVIADYSSPTRNGRKYPKELWENVFNNPITQEKIRNRACFGELGHPADRDELDPEKAAVCLAETPKLGEDGKLYGVFDILSTPCGKVLKSICDYGTTLGISSRGQGDVITDDLGDEAVDPDTYQFECFDIVLVPAVESARLQYVNESLENSKNNTLNLNRALCESLKTASAKDKKLMHEALKDFGYEVKEDLKEDLKSDQIPEKGDDKLTESKSPEQKSVKNDEANNDGSENLIDKLSEALAKNAELELRVKDLNEQLAVSNTEVSKFREEATHYKNAVARIEHVKTNSRDLEAKVSTLEEELKVKQQKIETLESENSKLTESIESDSSKSKTLTESISSKDAEIVKLNESLAKAKEESDNKIKELTESYEKEKSDSSNKIHELNESLAKASTLAEGYKKLAHETVSRYIDRQATMLGVTANEIKSRLSEKYTLDDVDNVCKAVRSYTSRINKLPFQMNQKARVQVKESVDESMRLPSQYDDSVDDGLIKLAESFIHK